MDIKTAAKAWLGGVIILGITWFGGVAENLTGVTLPTELTQGVAGYVADAVVSLAFGYLGYLGIWRVPNAPA